uniref:SERTA domain-containing protein n=1 Tax=Gopherus agassizii TaxID=38772 RepID=A0A452HNJ8_9SAUR
SSQGWGENPGVALSGRGRDLFTFVTVASSHMMRTLQRPRKSRPGKRRVNHRRFLHNQISRWEQFTDIEASMHRLASSILAQEAPRDPPPAPAASSFLGVAEAFVAPEPGPGWGLSMASLTPDPSDLFDPITSPEDLGLPPSWAPITHNPLEPSQCPLPWDSLPTPGTDGAPLWAPDPPGYLPPVTPAHPVGVAPGGW